MAQVELGFWPQYWAVLPQKKETKTCADISKAAADTKRDLPAFQADTWRYNDVSALQFDRASAQYALNEASFIADATNLGGSGLGATALRWKSLATRGFAIFGVAVGTANLGASAEVNMRQRHIAAYNARLRQLQAQADGTCKSK